MDLNWMISVDDHVIEPPNVWQDRVPAKLKDAAPRIVRDDQGEAWVYEDKRIPTPGLSAVVGKEKEEFSPAPRHLRRDAPRLLRLGRPPRGHGPRRGPGVALLPVLPPLLRAGLLRGRRP